ncbi:response regulator [Thiocystis violascens]|uniref:response regulator n=1 Tax=Thiocystis violascens TaxID=73141 RepID=UPI00022C3297|nr:response regulator [Thiocystis violascens]
MDAAPTAPPTILVVDDTPGNLDLLGRILTDAGYRVRQLPCGELALTSARTAPPDLILLDIRMPGLDGFEVCQRLKEEAITAEIPILFISALQDAGDKVRAFAAGGLDYITKPFQTEEVLARVATHLRLSALQRRLELQNRELERLATTDPLTGILNRRSFTDYGLHYLAHANRYGRPFGLIMFDIDKFKAVNDCHGHGVGDKVLVVVTERIRACLRGCRQK